MQSTETPVPGRDLTLPTVTPEVTPTPTVVPPPPAPSKTSAGVEVSCNVCSPEDTVLDDPGKVNRLPDVPTVSDFDLSEWLGDRVGDSIDWLFFGYDIPNFIVVYLAAIGLIFMIKYFNRLDALKEAEKELQILARLKEIDPDLVEEARVVATFPHLTGRVSVGDFDEEEYNFLFSPEKAMRAESI